MQKIVRSFAYTGSDQTFVIPNGVSNVFIQAWGAAGGSQGGTGGPGGYSQGTLSVLPTQSLTIIVGQGGINWGTSQTTCLLPTYGGGGGGGNATGEQYKGSSAGGRSAVRLSTAIEVLTAGGGGGSSSSYAESGGITAGSGGGVTGYSAFAGLTCYNSMMGKGGTQTTGGAGGTGWTAFNNGGAGTQYNGGTGGGGSNGGLSAGAAGGGGGGYFGGGGGAGEYQAGLGCPPSAGSQDCSGGGGSGYIGGVAQGLTLATTMPNTFPGTLNPPNNTDANYVSGIGVAKSGVGGNGLVVFTYTIPTLTKYVDKNYSKVGDTLNYTLVLDNISGITFNNIIFVDTIPNGTSFVSNSLLVNNNPVSGSPNPPGISLGNILNIITITYSVTVTTVPNPNPIPNIGTLGADNFNTTNSNSVVTTVNYLNLTSSKQVNRTLADIGYILTYTIPITNNGNVTASSLVFLDTIPNGTTLVSNSLKQDGAVVSGSSNFPGVTLPSNLAPGKTTTVTFQVTINTIPSPNPIPNTATTTGSYLVNPTTTPNLISNSAITTNRVNTQVNHASLGNTVKYVSSNYANCGSSLLYTIVIPNTGNVTAQNIILKDTIPNGTVFQNTSVFINNVPQSNAFPSTGITIPNIAPLTTATITFSVKVVC